MLRFYQHRRESTRGAFSISNAEIRVAEISDAKGNRHRGISIYGGLQGPFVAPERAIVLGEHDAKVMLSFLDRITRKEIPTFFSVSMNRVETFNWQVSTYLPQWHDGGGLRGTIGIKQFLGIRLVPATITVDAAHGLRSCIQDFYGIDAA